MTVSPTPQALARPIFLALAACSLALTSCGDDDEPAAPTEQVFTGERVAVGQGEAWTEVTLAADGSPQSLAAVFTEAALEGLPTGHTPPAHEYVLRLPADAALAPYDHVTLDWNAHGHAPPGVYDLPHFDVHFYFMSGAQRDAIGPHDSVAFDAPLPAEMLPPMYLETPGGVPRMGAHVIDLMSPEIAGTGAFTHTFIYGKYDGRLNFLEPMVAEDFLRGRPDVEVSIRRPERYGVSGHLPGAYRVRYEEATGTYRVALTDLERR